MTYDTIYSDFLSIFKEDTDYLNSIADENAVDNEDGKHIQFGMVVFPYILHLAKIKDTDKLTKAFDFLEEMLSTQDTMICEIVEFTILENLISEDKNILEYCRQFMKPRTIQSCHSVENYMM